MRLFRPALVAALAAAPLAAQEPLRAGETVSGRLEAGDARTEDGRPCDAYLLQGTPGDRVVLRMRSGAFDTELQVGPAEGEWALLDGNDDAGSGTDSYLVVTLDGGGRMRVRAAALEADGEGPYRLSAQPWREPATAPLRMGAEVRGALDVGDFAAANGPEDRYTLRGTAGQTITVSVQSAEFDPRVSIGQPVETAWEELAGDDDGGTGTDARLVYTFPESGVFQVAVFGFDEDSRGAYTLRVDEGETGADDPDEADPAADDGSGSSGTLLRAGDPVSGELTDADPALPDGSRYRDYLWAAQAGEQVTVDLSSDDFDGLLFWGTGTGGAFQERGSDDDGGEGRDARLVVTFPRTGTFTIRVNTLNAGETGPYDLIVRARR